MRMSSNSVESFHNGVKRVRPTNRTIQKLIAEILRQDLALENRFVQ
jgi:hypothetical protein